MHHHHNQKPSSSERIKLILITLGVLIVILQIYLLSHFISNTFNTLEADYNIAQKTLNKTRDRILKDSHMIAHLLEKEKKDHHYEEVLVKKLKKQARDAAKDAGELHIEQVVEDNEDRMKQQRDKEEIIQVVMDTANSLGNEKEKENNKDNNKRKEETDEKDDFLIDHDFLEHHPNIHTKPLAENLHHYTSTNNNKNKRKNRDFATKIMPPFSDDDENEEDANNYNHMMPPEARQLLDQYADIEPSQDDAEYIDDLVKRNIIRSKTGLLLKKVQALNHIMRTENRKISRNNGRRVVIVHPVGQLCNRLVSISSAFIFSLLGKRALYVDFETDFYCQASDLFLKPGFDWTSRGDLSAGIDLGKEQGYYSASSDMLLENPEQGPWSMAEPLLCSNFTSSPSTKKKSSNSHSHHQKTSTSFQDHPTVVIRTNQYLVPYMQRNKNYQKALEYFFPSTDGRGGVFHIISHFLFRPLPKLLKERDEYIREHFDNDDDNQESFVVGLQVRAGGDFTGNSMKDKDWNLYGDCARATVPKTMTTKRRKLKFFVATDTDAGRQKAKMVLSSSSSSSEVLFGPGKFLLSNHPRGVQMALLDILLLEQSDDLVTTAWSTFGYFAAGRAGHAANLVCDKVPDDKVVADPTKGEIQRYMGVKHKSDKRKQCVRLPTLQPCFHHFENWGASKTSCAEKNWLKEEMLGGRYC